MSKKIKVMLLVFIFVIAGGAFVGSSNVDFSSLGDSMREMASRIPIVRGLTLDKDSRLDRGDTRKIKKMVSETVEIRKELFKENKDGTLTLITDEPTKEQMENMKEYFENMRKFDKEYLAFMKGFHEYFFKDTQFISDGDGKGDWFEEEECEEGEECEEEEGYYTSEPEPPEPEPVLNPEDYIGEDGVFDFFGYISAYIDLFVTKPEDYTGDFVWVFPFTPPVLTINTDTLSAEDPRTASNFIACTLGTQAAMIDSVAFEMDGAKGGEVEFEVKAYTVDGEFNILDYPVLTWVGNWPGDINFPYQVSLDPGECMAFSIRYIGVYPEEWDQDYRPLWAQFATRGLGSSLPTYFIEHGTELEPLNDNNELKGALNVFEYQNAILLEGNNGESYLPLEANSYWLGSFWIETFPNTEASVESIDFYLDTTYDEPLEVNINYNVEQLSYYYNSPKSDNFEIINATLEPGLNTIYVDLDLSYANRVYISSYVYVDPEEAGEVSLNLVDVDYSGDKIEGSYDDYPSIDVGDNQVFDGLEGRILHFIDMEEGDAFVKADWSPSGNGVKWISEDKFAPGVYQKPGVAHLEFVHSIPTLDVGNAIEVEDFEFEVFGAFQNPVLLKLYHEGYTYFPDQDTWDYTEEEVGVFDVLPGDVIPVGSTTLYSGGWESYRLRVEEFPVDPGYGTVLLGLKVDDLSAHFVEAEAVDPNDPISILDPPQGPSAEVYVYDPETDSYLENFVYPIMYRISGFAPVLIYKETDYNTPYEMVILSDWADNDEPYTMNHVCMHAQGGATVYNFTYQHDQRDESPFEQVRLFTWDNTIYLDLESEWSEDYATFNLTNPMEYNNQDLCLTLEVALPTEEVNNAWFDLISIEAMDGEGNPLEVYETYQPPNNNVELSELHSIDGPIVNFYDF
ncbi:hypothetical protein HOG17_02675 [Candidatus Peregrinibacteria bacterium]|jgi:hypothetical protein|nr:hypothetical protein [Candidatus Peregrinibacteria bacterium]MBT4366549.1 hypothetical protein [Candidatus Peregrinibacteria bacterium]MBT4456113.1 hypothetical protein [Candidatus Peregrinibacteria bacterium]